MDRRVDIALAAIVVAFGLVILFISFNAPPPRAQFDPVGPYGFSKVVGTVFVILGVLILAKTFREARHGAEDELAAEGAEDEEGFPASARRAMALVALTFAYALALNPLGYVIASLIYVTVGLLILSERGRLMLAVTSIGYTALTFWAFAIFLRVPLPLGPLNELFVDLGIVDRIR
jgi:putative tricarboxylic transport membrane protein